MSAVDAKELLRTHRPSKDLNKDLLEEFNEVSEIFSYLQHSAKCDKDVSYTILKSALKCTGNCYKNVTEKNLTLDKNAKLPKYYELAYGCIAPNQPYHYARMTDEQNGNKVSFVYKDADFGSDMRAHQQLCAFTVVNRDATDAEKIACKMNMNKQCRQKIENSCIKSGLQDLIYLNKIHKPLPTVCDNFNPTYNLVNCMNWINARFLRNTFQIRINQLDLVPTYIGNEEEPEKKPARFLIRRLEDTYDEPTNAAVATEQQKTAINALPKLTDIEFDLLVEGSSESSVSYTDLKTIDEAAKVIEDPVPTPADKSASRIALSILSVIAIVFFMF
jgi:hypothetical protein